MWRLHDSRARPGSTGVGRGGRLCLTRTACLTLQVRTPFFLRTQIERVAGALVPGAEGASQRLRRHASSAAAAAASPPPPSSTLMLQTVCRNARVSPFIKLSLAEPVRNARITYTPPPRTHASENLSHRPTALPCTHTGTALRVCLVIDDDAETCALAHAHTRVRISGTCARCCWRARKLLRPGLLSSHTKCRRHGEVEGEGGVTRGVNKPSPEWAYTRIHRSEDTLICPSVLSLLVQFATLLARTLTKQTY